jgi:hypothetical protein
MSARLDSSSFTHLFQRGIEVAMQAGVRLVVGGISVRPAYAATPSIATWLPETTGSGLSPSCSTTWATSKQDLQARTGWPGRTTAVAVIVYTGRAVQN